jgi:hypothetical protein
MHSTINCENVFDVLTRGPVSLNEEPELREHLLHCSQCRQLAEAFRPVIGLIHESLDDQGLPRIEGLSEADELLFNVQQVEHKDVPWMAAADGDRHSHRMSVQVPNEVRPTTTPHSTPGWMPLIAAMLAGIALFGLNTPDAGDGSTAPANASEQVQLPPSHPPLVPTEGGTTLCCVECHHPKAEHSQPPVHILAQSCMTCHVHREL